MGLVIGIDEAGYGPNLGPLVVTATVWEVPGRPQKTDFWTAFAKIAERELAEDDDRLHIADSKAVYSTAKGLGPLERSVLAACGVRSRMPVGLHELLAGVLGREEVCSASREEWARDLWFHDVDLPLPFSEDGQSAGPAAERWQALCESSEIRLRDIRCDVVSPRRWNDATREADNKATALSRVTLQLLRKVWDPDTAGPTLVLADKHGGRNRYAVLLTECLDGQMVRCSGESRESSVYRVGKTEIRFEARSERHFPVALASMVSKYVRELTMELFNRFWCGHMPTLRPTHGYPTDAHRFRKDVAEMQSLLKIPDDILWRER